MTHSKREVLDRLEETGVVAVIRLNDAGALMDVSRALLDGGVTMLEVTMTVPDAIEMIRAASKELPKDVILGAGTVLDAVTARLAILAGAEFIVGPCTDAGVMQPAASNNRDAGHDVHRDRDGVEGGRGRSRSSRHRGHPTYFRTFAAAAPVKLMPTGNVDQTPPDIAPARWRLA